VSSGARGPVFWSELQLRDRRVYRPRMTLPLSPPWLALIVAI